MREVIHHPGIEVSDAGSLTRRELLCRLARLLALPLVGGISGCARTEPLVRIATNTWPGYEFMYQARERGYLGSHPIRLLEMGSASACLDMLSADTAEAAGLTLDEVLCAREQGLDLTVIALLDVSLGANAVLVRPGINGLGDLAGRRIGVERGAVGALMLDALLEAAGLAIDAISTVEVPMNRHFDAYQQSRADVMVSLEPAASRLESLGAQRIYDSRQIPGRIMNVLAARPKALESSPEALRALLKGHFQAHGEFIDDPTMHALMAQRLGGSAADVPKLFSGIDVLNVACNRDLLVVPSEGVSKISTQTRAIAEVMLRGQLLHEFPDLDRLFDSRLLPRADGL